MTRSRSNLRAPKAISPSAAPRRRDALLRRDRESRRPSCPSRQCASGRQRPWRSPEPWPSAGLRDELRQPHQIVGGGCEGEGPSDTIAAAEPGLLLPGHDLDPAERFLDAFPVTLADGIAAVLRRAAGRLAGEDTVTIELLATGHRVTIRADSGHVDLIVAVAARHQGRLHRL